MDPRFQAWLLRDEAAKEQQIGDSYADTAPDVAYAHRALAAAMRAGAEALAPLVPPASGVAQPATNVVAEKLPANPDPPMWVGVVLRLANVPTAEQRSPAFHERLQAGLADVIAGGLGVPAEAGAGPVDYPIPPMVMRVGWNRTQLLAQGPAPELLLDWDDPVIKGEDLPRLQTLEREFHGVVMLLAKHPVAKRLRRCDWHECRGFFFARADHRRDHSFCCTDHRRLYDVANRDPKRAAQYMRTWRAHPSRSKKARKKGTAVRKGKK